MGPLHELHRRWDDAVEVVIVYVREAHPEEGWVVTYNRDAGIRVSDPTTDEERVAVAADFARKLDVRIPIVVDAIDDEIARAYGGVPTRHYLIGVGGEILYQGGPGPFGLKIEELESAIEAALTDA